MKIIAVIIFICLKCQYAQGGGNTVSTVNHYFSLSGSRSSRAESLLFVHEMARCRPEVQTIILANNESEMHLIGHLMPACLHGILNKIRAATRATGAFAAATGQSSSQRQRTILRQRGVQRSAKPDGARHPSVYVVGIFAF